MANEYNTLITFESRSQIELVRLFEFVKELRSIDRYGVVNINGMNFLHGGYATFEIKVVGYNDSGIEPFLKIVNDGFPFTSIYYTSNDGCEYYLTNDENGKYYPFKFELEIYSDDPGISKCTRLGFVDYEGIKRFLFEKYGYELSEGISFVPNAIQDTYNIKISEYEEVC